MARSCLLTRLIGSSRSGSPPPGRAAMSVGDGTTAVTSHSRSVGTCEVMLLAVDPAFRMAIGAGARIAAATRGLEHSESAGHLLPLRVGAAVGVVRLIGGIPN